jgi:hypothetical protein
MGLHRDGEILGLGPFESEMRRRLWWQIIMLDAKYAMLSGLSHSLLPRGWDTKAPKNVNDADIFPSATDPFLDRDGPTEMIFCLMTYKIAQFLVQSPGLEAVILATELEVAGPGGPNSAQLAEYRKTIENLGRELLTLLDKYCDPTAGPVHVMAIDMRTHILQKLMELITPPKDQPEWGSEIRTRKDNAFKVAVGTLEHNEQSYEAAKDKGFLWFSMLHFQIDVFMYMAGQLCHRTEGKLVDRAWRQVEVVYAFHRELLDVATNKTYATLAVFILKAWKTREETILQHTGQAPEVPFYIEHLRATMPNDDYKTVPTPPAPLMTAVSSQAAKKPAMQQDPTYDQFLGGYLDVSALEWDMFSNMQQTAAVAVTQNGTTQTTAAAPTFGGPLWGMGPGPEW